ncbi:Thioredoxin-like fold [Amanita muscaria]
MHHHSKVATLTNRVVKPDQRVTMDDDEDDEALFAALEAEIENDDDPVLRERGLEALKKEFEAVSKMRESSHGSYIEVADEKEVMRVSASDPRCVIHFYHSNFKRCEIMDKHLAILARKYFHTRFIRVFVENVPWLVQRLSVKVLPCVISFIDGVLKDRLIGFEEVGNTDSFTTALLETRLLATGDPPATASQIVSNVVLTHHSTADDDELFDL